jgi:hypothetical protein
MMCEHRTVVVEPSYQALPRPASLNADVVDGRDIVGPNGTFQRRETPQRFRVKFAYGVRQTAIERKRLPLGCASLPSGQLSRFCGLTPAYVRERLTRMPCCPTS